MKFLIFIYLILTPIDHIIQEVRFRVFEQGIENLDDYIKWFDSNKKEEAIFIAYDAFNKALLANDSWSPVSKLEYVKQGRLLYEKSIKLDPQNIEIRLLRFTTELQIPAFLQDKASIKNDAEKILNILNLFGPPKLDSFEEKYFIKILSRHKNEFPEIFKAFSE